MTCPHCHRPLIEIDHYGERFCMECNRWGWEGSAFFMELPEEDLKGAKKEGPLARKQGPVTLYLHSLTREP
jgi:uncharacterized Zn finger protein (UPF0148 family)